MGASSWFPAETLASPRVAQRAIDIVAAWSERWIAVEPWQAATGFQRSAGDASITLRQGGHVDLVGSPATRSELAFAMLGVRPRKELTAADMKLVRRMTTAALDDLHTGIAAAYPAKASRGPRWRLSVRRGESAPLAIELDHETLAAAARDLLRSPASRAAPISRRQALTDQPVPCACCLGRSTLTAGQVRALEVGDVIVLDQPVGDTVALMVAGRRTRFRATFSDVSAPNHAQD